MWNVGVHTGYQPVQPIKFSHQLHAGVNKIECQYCHGGAFKSKNASIPSANVCMNCHNTITGSEHYDGEISPEIAKIYRALDFNPETRTYGNNPKPIQWVRIHICCLMTINTQLHRQRRVLIYFFHRFNWPVTSLTFYSRYCNVL